MDLEETSYEEILGLFPNGPARDIEDYQKSFSKKWDKGSLLSSHNVEGSLLSSRNVKGSLLSSFFHSLNVMTLRPMLSPLKFRFSYKRPKEDGDNITHDQTNEKKIARDLIL